ncbi:hypothetical protein XENOCAPTIV_028826, partial [Xenoophorus captivus]
LVFFRSLTAESPLNIETAKSSTKAEESIQARTCPCVNKISSWDTHLACVVRLGLKHAQAAFESGEECSHCNRFSLKVLRRRVARQSTLSSNDSVLATTASVQEPADQAVSLTTDAVAGPSRGEILDAVDPLPPEMSEHGPASGSLDLLMVGDDELSGVGDALLGHR